MKYYAGIGSRETPKSLKPTIEKIMNLLNKKVFILRSGGAPGADSFFEEYSVPELREIYLPWKGFNDNKSELYSITTEALEFASKYHPGWHNLSFGVKKLMARNCYQVLGLDLETPVEFVLCWTKDGKASGGTGQAMRIAVDKKIPIFNLRNQSDLDNFLKKYDAII